MYKSFHIKNFRCFRSLKLDRLKRVNLIVGKNNVGKTALLEALFIHAGAYNPELTLRINAFRGIESVTVEWSGWKETPWDTIFYNFDTNREIELIGEGDEGFNRILRIRVVRDVQKLKELIQTIKKQDGGMPSMSLEAAKVLELESEEGGQSERFYMFISPHGLQMPIHPPPPFPAIFLASRRSNLPQERAERFGRLQILGKKHLLLNAIKVIEPQLRDVVEVTLGGQPLLYGDLGRERLVPLQIVGEGMVRLTDLVLNIVNASQGIVVVDEIETGFHHSVLEEVWRTVDKVSRESNTQVFATTHSLECIRAAHKAFAESEEYDFQLYRLETFDKDIFVTTYDQETLEAAIELELEVR